jgi:cyclophilin family peptidyl-prolyl cis-trans isomerase
LVDKPGRRKRRRFPWGKVAGAALTVLVVAGVSWIVYWNYIFVPPPVYAELGTSQGDIYLELFPNCAPATVSNFVSLAKSGFYNDLVWHRIVRGFVIQTGDPNTRGGLNSTRSTWGEGGSNKTVPLEVTRCPGLVNDAGTVALARRGNQTSGLDTGSSQFYVVLDNQTAGTLALLDGYYTIFGKVISGMSAVCALANNRTDPVYPANVSPSYLFSQPIDPARAMLYNVTIIPPSEAPTPQPVKQC